jgi:glycosyltransferase involved in cell wall biosynthesis
VKILFAMTYYRPYVSGPIIYVENLASELLRRGHEITFLASQHIPTLPVEEVTNGIRVVRLPVMFRLSKGVIMRGFLKSASRLIREHDVVLIQVPQFEAAALAVLSRHHRRPSALVYHCDVQLPPGAFNWLVSRGLTVLNLVAARFASRNVAYTRDYATHSPVMKRFMHKVTVIPPPVYIPGAPPARVCAFREKYGLDPGPVIGIAGRLSAEKGYHVLLDAIDILLEQFPHIHVLHAGEANEVIGEAAYRDCLTGKLARHQGRWHSLGVLGAEELAVFYAACDVTVLPSLNRTESFGLVQVESMLTGTPVVASDLPGVRVPVGTTGMGLVTAPGDVDGLAKALARVLSSPEQFRKPKQEVEALYSVDRTCAGYDQLLVVLGGSSGPT